MSDALAFIHEHLTAIVFVVACVGLYSLMVAELLKKRK